MTHNLVIASENRSESYEPPCKPLDRKAYFKWCSKIHKMGNQFTAMHKLHEKSRKFKFKLLCMIKTKCRD